MGRFSGSRSSCPQRACPSPTQAQPCPAPSCGSWAQFRLQTPSPGRCQTLTVLSAFLNTLSVKCFGSFLLVLRASWPSGLEPEAPRGFRPSCDS